MSDTPAVEPKGFDLNAVLAQAKIERGAAVKRIADAQATQKSLASVIAQARDEVKNLDKLIKSQTPRRRSATAKPPAPKP